MLAPSSSVSKTQIASDSQAGAVVGVGVVEKVETRIGVGVEVILVSKIILKVC